MEYDDGLPGVFHMPLRLEFGADVLGRTNQVSWNRSGFTGTADALASYSYLGGRKRQRVMTVQGVGSSTSKTVKSTFGYDAKFRLASILDEVVGTSGALRRFDYEYDADSSLEKEIYEKQGSSDPDGGDRFTYDDHNRLEDAWLGANQEFMDKSDPTQPLQGAEAFVRRLTYGLDDANNRTSVVNEVFGGSTTSESYALETVGSDSVANRYATVDGADLLYDKRGNLIFDGVYYYAYDYRNRLSEVMEPSTSGGTTSQSGAMATSTTSLSSGGTTTDRYVVLDAEQLKRSAAGVRSNYGSMDDVLESCRTSGYQSSVSAPLRGALTPVNRTASGGRRGLLRFGPWRPLSLALQPVAFYAYDALHRRTLRIVLGAEPQQRVHVWDGWQEVQDAEYTLDGQGGFGVLPEQQFVWGLGLDELVAYRDRTIEDINGTLVANTFEYWVTQGRQESTSVVLDAAAEDVERSEYGPYGKVSRFSAGLGIQGRGLSFAWKGMRVDAETTNAYRRHRFYSFNTGRFMSRDPLGDWMDPNNLGNAYGYAGVNPLVYDDRMGLMSVGGGVFLRPKGDKDYVGAVIRALEKLCPCYAFIDADVTEKDRARGVSTSLRRLYRMSLSKCSECYAHKIGCALVNRLFDDGDGGWLGGTPRIIRNAGGPSFVTPRNEDGEPKEPVLIELGKSATKASKSYKKRNNLFDAQKNMLGDDAALAVILAHELAHLADVSAGGPETDRDTDAELLASTIENRVRKELGVNLRTVYSFKIDRGEVRSHTLRLPVPLEPSRFSERADELCGKK